MDYAGLYEDILAIQRRAEAEMYFYAEWDDADRFVEECRNFRRSLLLVGWNCWAWYS